MSQTTEQQTERLSEEAQLPTTLVDQITIDMGLTRGDEEYGLVRPGIQFLLTELLSLDKDKVRADQAVVNEMITAIDAKLSEQVDAILHDREFQKLESAWRGLKLVVDHTDFRENIKLELLNISKEELLADFVDAPEINKSGLYKTVYTAEYGQFGGSPIGAIIGNYEFGPGPQDIKLLQYVASVATVAHAPFIAAAAPQFFGEADFLKLPNLKDVKGLVEGFIKWNSFRESEDARMVGLTLPRFLLRLPYHQEGNPIRAFNYNENVVDDHEHYLWGNAAFAFATRLTDSFAKWRWCPNIIGPLGGGAVEDLPIHTFDAMGIRESKIPTEILLPERKAFELSEEGFIPLEMRKGSDNACFFTANSCQKPKYFGQNPESKEAAANYKLGTQLPYTFIISRLAHYLKVLQREQIGTWKERTDLELQLNKWIKQYVADQDVVAPGVRARRPLRQAKVMVSSIEGDPGWYRVDMEVRPHFKYMGVFVTLSLVGKLDKQ